MPIYSSDATNWDDFDGEEPTVRGAFLSGPANQISLNFPEFAKFVYDKVVDNTTNGHTDVNKNQLLWGIYNYFIDPLLQHTTAGAPQPTGDGKGLLLATGGINDGAFFNYLFAYFQSLTTDVDRYNFQYYLQLGLYHFVVWYLCEKKGNSKGGVVRDGSAAVFDFVLNGQTPPTSLQNAKVTLIDPQDNSQEYEYRPFSSPTINNGLTYIGALYETGSNAESFWVDHLIHAFSDDFRNAATEKLKWKLQREGIEFSDGFYDSYYYKRCFTAEMCVNELTSADGLGVVTVPARRSGLFKVFDYTSGIPPVKKRNRLRPEDARRVLSKTMGAFHDALLDILDEELQYVVSCLSPPLRASFTSIRHFGVGDGTPTKALFGEYAYGLCFVRYAFDLTGAVPTVKASIPDIEVLSARTDSVDTNVSILYYGLDKDFTAISNMAPSVVLTPTAAATDPTPKTWVCVSPTKCFPMPARGSTSATDGLVHLASFNGSTVSRVTATFNSSVPLPSDHDHEEMVYVIFKNSIPRPIIITHTGPGILYAKQFFPSNDYKITSSQSDQFFAAGSDPQTLQSLILALQGNNNFDFDVESDLVGCGLGNKTGSSAIWDEVVSALDQRDDPTTNDPDLRRASGLIVLEYGDGGKRMRIVFAVAGYVAPPPCSWKTWTNWTSDQAGWAQTYIGSHMRKSGADPIYNPALSAMRAFSMFEGMVNRIIAYATTMKNNGDITQTDLNTITLKLNDHLRNVAGAQFSQPGVGGNGAPGPTVVRDHDDHTLVPVELGGVKNSVLYITYNLFDLLRY